MDGRYKNSATNIQNIAGNKGGTIGVSQILANHQLAQQPQLINLPSNIGAANKT